MVLACPGASRNHRANRTWCDRRGMVVPGCRSVYIPIEQQISGFSMGINTLPIYRYIAMATYIGIDSDNPYTFGFPKCMVGFH